MIRLRNFISGLSRMSEEAFCLLAGTLKTCCTMVFCSFLILVHTGGLSVQDYDLYRLAGELVSSSLGVFLVGNLAALFLEELPRRR